MSVCVYVCLCVCLCLWKQEEKELEREREVNKPINRMITEQFILFGKSQVML